MCRKFDEIPKCLLPKINKAGTINPMMIPAVYQGQGARKISIMVSLLSLTDKCKKNHLIIKLKDTHSPLVDISPIP